MKLNEHIGPLVIPNSTFTNPNNLENQFQILLWRALPYAHQPPDWKIAWESLRKWEGRA